MAAAAFRALVVAAAVSAAAVSPVFADQTTPVLVDADMTAGAGATVIVALGAAVSRAEDTVVPDRLFVERGWKRRTTNVGYRALKFWYFDVPQEELLLVVNHEVFGHGARLRELFDGRIGYRIDVPTPYGPGGGATFFNFDREPTYEDLLAVSAGGMEANGVAAGLMSHRAFLDRRMRPRDALRYLGFELDIVTYVLRTGDGSESPGHDVFSFLQTYNEQADLAGAPSLTAQTLRREVLLGLANPMLGYAIFGIGRYLWNGATDVAVPAWSIAGVRYLPMMRYRLTPYGTRVGARERACRTRPAHADRNPAGRAVEATPWGIGVRLDQLMTGRSWRSNLRVDLWRQPRIPESASETPESTAVELGGAVIGRIERDLGRLWFGAEPATLVVDVGVKTNGFLPGERLQAGAVLRAGVGLPLRP